MIQNFPLCKANLGKEQNTSSGVSTKTKLSLNSIGKHFTHEVALTLNYNHENVEYYLFLYRLLPQIRKVFKTSYLD